MHNRVHLGITLILNLKSSVVASVHDTCTVSLHQPVSRPVALVTAAKWVLHTPSLGHVEPFGVPYVRLHPCAVRFLAQLIEIEQEAELAPVTTTFRTGEHFALVGIQLVQGAEPDAHWDAVIVVSHASPAQVS